MRTAEDVVTPEQTGRILRVVPEREGHRLELQWAVPPEKRAFRHFPCGYLGHLLGCAALPCLAAGFRRLPGPASFGVARLVALPQPRHILC